MALSDDGGRHCARHAAARREQEAKRRQAAKIGSAEWAWFYRTAEWRDMREAFLRRNPLCADCGELGAVVAATQLDHIKPHRGDPHLMRSRSNLQGLCHSCHSRKTAREVLRPGGC